MSNLDLQIGHPLLLLQWPRGDKHNSAFRLEHHNLRADGWFKWAEKPSEGAKNLMLNFLLHYLHPKTAQARGRLLNESNMYQKVWLRCECCQEWWHQVHPAGALRLRRTPCWDHWGLTCRPLHSQQRWQTLVANLDEDPGLCSQCLLSVTVRAWIKQMI